MKSYELQIETFMELLKSLVDDFSESYKKDCLSAKQKEYFLGDIDDKNFSIVLDKIIFHNREVFIEYRLSEERNKNTMQDIHLSRVFRIQD